MNLRYKSIWAIWKQYLGDTGSENKLQQHKACALMLS